MTRVLAILAFLAVTAGPSALAQEPPPRAIPVPAGAADVRASYRLKPNDVVLLAVFDEPELATETRILKTGEAVFPLIGTVAIGGLTLKEATERIRGLFAADYLVDPKVSLSVGEYAVDFVSVLGAVKSPGQIPIPSSGRLDLASALAASGGLAPNADPNRITVIRASGSRTVYAESAIRSGGGVPLASGDRIVIDESRFLNQTVTVLGQVRTPGPVEFPLDGQLDLLTAVARAGGFTELANKRKVTVSRDGRTTVFDMRDGKEHASKQYLLRPDDIVTVAERVF